MDVRVRASVDTMGALVTPLFTLCNPGVALWLSVGVRVRPCHDVWWVSASISNVARMHAMKRGWIMVTVCTMYLVLKTSPL